MTKIDCVWISAASLAYEVCLDNEDWTLDDIHFSQQEIVKRAKEITGDEIPNALVSQHACAYSNSQHRNCMYLVAKDIKRRISYSGEFDGKLERPNFSEMKNNIVVHTKRGEINIDDLIKFVDDVYSPKMKKLLVDYFSKYDLGGVFDYIVEFDGKHFIAVEKAGSRANEMKRYKALGSAARKCVKSFAEEIKSCMPQYEKTDVSGWVNQGQNTVDYIWAQLRKKSKEDSPTSLSVFFEKRRINDSKSEMELRISVEAQDSKCGKDAEKYYKHARLLEIEKKPGLDYFVGGSLPGELVISQKTAEEILQDIYQGDNKKVQICKVMPEADVRNKSAYEVYQFMTQAAYELKPYYDAAVAGENEMWWPTLEEYDPGVTAEQYEQILSNEEKVKREFLDTIHYLYLMGGSGTCKQIADKFGNVYGHYNSHGKSVAEIVQKETGCPIRQRDEGGNSYWPILFYGRDAGKQENGTFAWKLREPLAEAVEKMIEKGILKMNNLEKITNPNIILYGPPGTGKTYNTVNYAVSIIEEKSYEEITKEAYDDVKTRYDEYLAKGQIAFTTFHQSYGYEEFIEGIKPLTDDNSGEIRYSVEGGVFKEFCSRAETPDVGNINHSAKVWKIILKNETLNDLKQECFRDGIIKVDLKTAEEHEGQYNYYQVGHFKDKMQIGDFVISYAGKSTRIDAIGIIEGDAVYDETKESYRWSRKVNWLTTQINEDIYELNGKKFLSGDLFCVQKNINVSELLRLVPEYSTVDNKKKYVFIIDEINRGNISKIFGELITLIEDTKRKGMPEAASAILPYSGKEFSVPSNVFILGTMNTADRSIAIMDTALRRRFSFIEKMPQPQLLNGVNVKQGGTSVNIGEMLDTINKRIEFLFDREHTIGHAFFMKLKENPDISVLADIFKRSVVPLLQEYFYEDYEKIQLVLGDNGKAEDKHKFIKSEVITPSHLFRGRSRLEKSTKYEINNDAFQWIDSYIGILNPEIDNKDEE